jgi:hypothetical protein
MFDHSKRDTGISNKICPYVEVGLASQQNLFACLLMTVGLSADKQDQFS